MYRQLYKLLSVTVVLISLSACGQKLSDGAANSQQSIEASCNYVDEATLPAQIQLTVPYVKQDPNYCGPASLSMVMGFYGSTVDQHDIGADIMGPSGTSTGDLMNKAEIYGYQGSVVSCGFGGLLGLISKGKPAIVRILNDAGTNGHFIVVTGYDKTSEQVFINDPDQPNKKSLSFADFQARWNITAFQSKSDNSYDLTMIVEPTTKIAQL